MSDRTRGEDGGRGPTSTKPPATSVQAKRLPHAAKVAQAKTRSPHPATIVQPKPAFGVPATRPPHPATVVQRRVGPPAAAQRSAWGSGGKSGVDIVKQPPKPQPKPPPPKKTVTYVWHIFQSARNHYKDAWGAAYGITNDTELEDMIWASWENKDDDELEIYLGQFKTKTQPLKGCNILYNNSWSEDGWTCTINVWHCGPTIKAG